MTHYELWESQFKGYTVPDEPFPPAMMPDIERFFREVHPTLTPGQDSYPEVFATELFFPLQRRKELEAMIRIARKAGPLCRECEARKWAFGGGTRPDCEVCKGLGTSGPVTVMEIGADKGGGLYHWCQCLPTVRNVIACEIRGTPYMHEFDDAFEHEFCWLPAQSSYVPDTIQRVKNFLFHAKENERLIDVLFIDGDKAGMLKDFEAYLPLMRRPGGVVFTHDVSDDFPAKAFRTVMERGYRCEVIVDRSEGIEAGERADRGELPRNPHDGWLMHWRGRSCGVGVIYV